MKSVIHKIFEASSKPSDLKKYKHTERKETLHFKSGDIYDLSDPGYEDEFTYYDGSGNGYIKDKNGKVYDVIASTSSGDAGRIAGGSTSYYVCIKKADGEHDFVVNGYIALFSKGYNTGCVDDIKRGYYLEDYIAKYYSRENGTSKFKEIANRGDANAKSWEANKKDMEAERINKFQSRYVPIPDTIYFEINDNGFTILDWSPGSSEELRAKRKELSNTRYWNDDNTRNQRHKELDEEVKELQKKADDLITSTFKALLIDKLSKVFKTKDINTLKGIGGKFYYTKHYYSKSTKNSYISDTYVYGIDSKTKKIVKMLPKLGKIVNDDINFALDDMITVNKDKMNEKVEKLFKRVADEWKKAHARKQTEYVKNNWERIQRESGSFWTGRIKAGEAKRRAIEEYEKYIKDHDWDSNKKLQFSLSLIQLYVEGDMTPDAEPVEKPLENPEPKETEKKERGKNTVMSKGANKAAYDKMKAWHEGTRKQNLSNCSDAKLKMNYKVCKELGYDKEMGQIETEAKKRNLVLESISLAEWVYADYEIDE